MRSFALPAGLLLIIGALSACGSGSGGETGVTATKVVFTSQPGDIIAGGHFDPVVSVQVQDDAGNRASTSSANVRVHLKSGGGPGALTGITSHAAVSGDATFPALGLDGAGDYQMVAVSTDLDSAFSATFTVAPAPPPPTSIEVSVGNAAGGTVYRSVRNGSQNPAVDTLAVTGTVTWTWVGGTHGVQSTGSNTFTGSGPATGVVGTEYAFQFNSQGTYTYNCSVHANGMTGSVVVK